MAEKILFVDDEPSILDGYRRSLRQEFDIATALGGRQGLALIQSNGPFAIVISDMRMPEMDGAQFLALVRQKNPDSVRMLLTGHADFDAAIEAVNRGNIYKFLTKPCEKPTLVEAIHCGLAHYRAATTQRELAKKAQVLEQAKSCWDAPGSDEAGSFKRIAGLPGPDEAQTYLKDRFGADRQCYVLMIKLPALHTVEDRYGEKAATGYMMGALGILAQSLNPDDRIFHWNSDVLMAVIRRHGAPTAIRTEVSRLFLDSPQHLIEHNGGKTMVTLAMRFEILPVAQFSILDELLAAFKARQIEIA